MTGSDRSSAGLDPRRRRLLFRAWRRGLREMDLAMGQFADAELASLGPAELDQFERLLDEPDPNVLSWINGEAVTPEFFATPLFDRLKAAAQFKGLK